jgi:hypothetical protein
MKLTLLAFSIPFFLLIMGLEYACVRWKGKDFFRFNDSVANLSVGIAERLLDLFTIGAFYMINCGALLEQRRWVLHLELACFLILCPLSLALRNNGPSDANGAGLHRWPVLVGLSNHHSAILFRLFIRIN